MKQKLCFWPHDGETDFTRPNTEWLVYEVKEFLKLNCTQKQGEKLVNSLPSPSDANEDDDDSDDAEKENGKG